MLGDKESIKEHWYDKTLIDGYKSDFDFLTKLFGLLWKDEI